MDEERSWRLYKKYPKLYRRRPQFECGIGWYDLLDSMSKDLEACIAEYQHLTWDKDEDLPCTEQVKEKFGTLCFYMSTATDEMHKIIDNATDKSGKTCERCGVRGFLRWYRGWKMTLCNTCFGVPEAESM